MDCEEIITLHRVDSTNSWLRRLIDGADAAIEVRHGLAVTARRQEAGRGQRGNAWESAPGATSHFPYSSTPKGYTPPNSLPFQKLWPWPHCAQRRISSTRKQPRDCA